MLHAQHCRKLDEKAIKYIFNGYSVDIKGYKLHHPQTKCILASCDVVFIEDVVQPLPKNQTWPHKMYMIH